MLRNREIARFAVGTAIALSLTAAGLAQPVGQGLVPEKLPALVKAIAAELDSLWDKVKEIPALKEALGKPMALAKEALEALGEAEGPGPEAFRDLVVLSLALHRIEDILERGIGQRVRAHFQGGGPGFVMGGPRGRGPIAGAERFGEVRDWIEAYLRGAMSALSPEEAARFRGIMEGLIRGLREEFVPRGPEAERPRALELGKHIVRIKALSAKLDLFLLRAAKAAEAAG